MPWEKQFDMDQVLKKAMRAFWDRGYECTSMQDLVDHTGVNRGNRYATYGDKHALFVAALRRYDEKRRADALPALEAAFRATRGDTRAVPFVFRPGVGARQEQRLLFDQHRVGPGRTRCPSRQDRCPFAGADRDVFRPHDRVGEGAL